MPQVCPVCNGMTAILATCSHCQSAMDDQGNAADYWGPYAPYAEQADGCWRNDRFHVDRMFREPATDEVKLQADQAYCPHIVACTRCGRLRTVAVPLVHTPGPGSP